MPFTKMVSMRRVPEKPSETMMCDAPCGIANPADYPYGLCISLGNDEIEKLGLMDEMRNAGIGDMLDLRAFARVTSLNMTERDSKPEYRLEMQITDLAVEDEATEGADDESKE